MQHLQHNTTLQSGKYRIERVLGQGGFGNTYVGYNTEFEETVAIKEFFMKGVTERDETTCAVSVSNADNVGQFEEQREKFKKEARRLRKLKNEHIVKVHDLFEENGTAYYVMDYIDGESLAEKMKRTGQPFSETEVRNILTQILDALKEVHQNEIWHLDLKPGNIMIDKGGNAYLIDFGASKQIRANGSMTTSTALCYTPGYAPNEQIGQMYDRFGPWTDIYALGATIYNLLTNKKPPMAIDIEEDEEDAFEFPNNISEDMRKLVMWMMQPQRKARPQKIDEIQNKIIQYKNHIIPLCSKNENDSEKSVLSSPDFFDSEETVVMGNGYEKTTTSYIEEKYKMGLMYENGDGVNNDAAEAAKYYKSAALQGNALAQYHLGLLFYEGEDVCQDFEEALKWFLKAADQGVPGAQNYIGLMYENGEGVEEDYEEAMKWFLKAAEQGDPVAQYNLGDMYRNGVGVDEDYEEAMKWYRKSAEQEDEDAQNIIGLMYENGEGVEVDYKEAIKWYRKAAEHGYSVAQYNLGDMYEYGKGVLKDDKEAIKWYRMAAEQGNDNAQLRLGLIYFSDDSNKKDYPTALKWFHMAAEQGNSDAQFVLGNMYRNGEGVDENYEEAMKWYLKAAEREDQDAQNIIGLMYENGEGVEVDYKEAFKWFFKAAEQGHAIAQYNLGDMYEFGRGRVENKKMAIKWYRKAAENGDDDAKEKLKELAKWL